MIKAGYWLGEFGWELMTWVPYLRRLARDNEILVGCEESHWPLYEDFATKAEFCDGNVSAKNMWYHDGGEVSGIKGGIAPSKEICHSKEREYIKYGRKIQAYENLVVVHARATKNMRTGYRNWPDERWDAVCGAISAKGFDVWSIGTAGGARCVKGTYDMRGLSLGYVMNILASAKACIGPSSGPMHLASLCGCPHLVWTDDQKQVVGCTNRDRYEKLWNPFDTPVRVIDSGWQPEIQHVIDEFELLICR